MREPIFGEWLRNTFAGETNPQRDGMYVQTVIRPRGSVNSGKCYKLTDGKGNFWQGSPDALVRLDCEAMEDPIKVRRGGKADTVSEPMADEELQACRERASSMSTMLAGDALRFSGRCIPRLLATIEARDAEIDRLKKQLERLRSMGRGCGQ